MEHTDHSLDASGLESTGSQVIQPFPRTPHPVLRRRILTNRFHRMVSNREPQEWLAMMADTLLAQSAVDRLLNSAYELVLDDESYRRGRKPVRGSSLS